MCLLHTEDPYGATHRARPHVRVPSQTAALSKARTGRLHHISKEQPRPIFPQARDAVLQHCQYDDGKRYDLHAVVVTPEHVHLLLTPLRGEKGWPYGLPSILKRLKGTSARSANKLLDSSGPVWQEESFDHLPRCPEKFEEEIEYIRNNPVRRGLVGKPEDYPWLWYRTDSLARHD